jgi:hypothetical protein
MRHDGAFSGSFAMRRTTRLLGMAAVLAIAAAGLALAQTTPAQQQTGPGQRQGMMQSGRQAMGPERMQEMMARHRGMMPMGGRGGMQAPTLPGQDAFGAIQEIVGMLEADPKTDWSKVNLEALRQHLIDMNDVTLKAGVAAKIVPGGIRVAVTGTGRTIAAIKRMVPDQAAMIDAIHPQGWSARPSRCRMASLSRSPRKIGSRSKSFAASALSASWRAATITKCTTSRWPKVHPCICTERGPLGSRDGSRIRAAATKVQQTLVGVAG